MKKNILIIGAARCGKTTLARKLNKEYGYSVISIDDIVSGLSSYPELNIHHDGDDNLTTKNLGPFLEKYFILPMAIPPHTDFADISTISVPSLKCPALTNICDRLYHN